jgi:CheY-like chemotaxis protein
MSEKPEHRGALAPNILRVLIVDDDPELLALHALVFGNDFTIHTANSAQEALALLNSGEEFDVVLTDFDMPVHDGVWLLEYVREHHPRIRRLLMSSTTSFKVRGRAPPGAFEKFFRKPVEPSALSEHLG